MENIDEDIKIVEWFLNKFSDYMVCTKISTKSLNELEKAIENLLSRLKTAERMIELMAELIFNHRNSFEWWENGLDIDNLEQQIEYFRNKAKESE